MNEIQQNEMDSKIDWKVFYGAMVIVFAIVAYLATQVNYTQAQVATSVASVANIQDQLGEIQTDVAWIKSNINQK